MSQSEELLKLENALAAKKMEKGDDEASDEGEGSTGGQGTVVEMRMFVETFGLLRQGEKQFGPTSEFDPLAYLAKSDPRFRGELGHQRDNQLKAHPILSQLSKFDGDTPHMSMDPKQNPEAQDRYENKLQLQMGLKHQHQMTLKPGGV